MTDFDATVVGAGPNGLAAALELARNGRKVLVVEGSDRIGGGTRTEELTLPGFKHDVCSAIHPSAVASPFLRDLDLDIDWIYPPIPVSHPLGDGRATALFRSVETTAERLGVDGKRYRRTMEPMVNRMEDLIGMLLGPVLPIPRHPVPMARATFQGGLPASLGGRRFRTPEARALFAGLAAHSLAPFSRLATSGVGLVMGAIGHAIGWPMARGGSQAVADAMARRIEDLGGSIETGRMVTGLDGLPGDIFLLDVMPPAALRIGGSRIGPGPRRRLGRWRPGEGVFKVDWALDGPVPWSDPLSAQAGTVHIGGTFEEIEAAERAVFRGEHPEQPFVLVAQQSLFDDSRAPEGKHTLWGYCHVPSGSKVDMTEAIESQIERFAPGFRDRIIGRATMHSVQYEAYNPNLVGGDIGGGRFGVGKILQVGANRPYDLGGGVYLCSSATPPGAGVHGMCGYNAARSALRKS